MERLGSAAGPQRMEAHGDGLLHQLPLAVTAPQVERRGFKVCPLHPAPRQAQLSSARAVPSPPCGSVQEEAQCLVPPTLFMPSPVPGCSQEGSWGCVHYWGCFKEP